MSRQIPLTVSAPVTLDGDGNGTVSLGPTGAGVTWQVASVGVMVSTNVAEATCQVYFAGQLADTALWGSTGGGSGLVAGQLSPGQEVAATWTGGDAGAVATLSVFGTQETG